MKTVEVDPLRVVADPCTPMTYLRECCAKLAGYKLRRDKHSKHNLAIYVRPDICLLACDAEFDDPAIQPDSDTKPFHDAYRYVFDYENNPTATDDLAKYVADKMCQAGYDVIFKCEYYPHTYAWAVNIRCGWHDCIGEGLTRTEAIVRAMEAITRNQEIMREVFPDVEA